MSTSICTTGRQQVVNIRSDCEIANGCIILGYGQDGTAHTWADWLFSGPLDAPNYLPTGGTRGSLITFCGRNFIYTPVAVREFLF